MSLSLSKERPVLVVCTLFFHFWKSSAREMHHFTNQIKLPLALAVAGLDKGFWSFGFVIISPSGEWKPPAGRGDCAKIPDKAHSFR